MKICSDDCEPLCDFCIYLERTETNKNDGESMCLKHNKIVDWLDDCEDFHCRRVKDEG
jgi:hypothetical protein